MEIKVAVLQYEILPAEKSANLKTLKKFFAAAAEEGAEAVLLPELFNCGYAADIAAQAENIGGRSVKAVSALCAEHGMALLGGSFAEKKGDRLYNTSLCMDAQGEIIAKYRKVHLFDGEVRETDRLQPGDEWVTADIMGVQTGMLTCFDLRFPAFAQNLALRGAEMLCLSAQWPAERLEHWRTLARARAIENEVWLLACNSCGGELFRSAGHSLIIAPDGEIVAEAGDEPCLLTAVIDTQRKGLFDILSRRLPILDEIDDSLF